MDARALVTATAEVLTAGLGNSALLFYVALSYLLIVRLRSSDTARIFSIFFGIAGFLILFYFVDSARYQNMLALAVILLMVMVRPTRRVMVSVVVLIVGAYALAVPFAPRIFQIDRNSGYRLYRTQEAFVGLRDSYGLGVGYGKEVITGFYARSGVVRLEVSTTAQTLATQGVHNSLAEQFMRLGLAGGLCVSWLFLVTCFPARAGPLRVRRHVATVYLLLLISVLFNVALESPTYIIGVAFGVGYILATNSWLRSSGRVRPDPGPRQTDSRPMGGLP